MDEEVMVELIGGPLDGQEVDIGFLPDRHQLTSLTFAVCHNDEPTDEIAVYEVRQWRNNLALVYAGTRYAGEGATHDLTQST